MQVNGAAGSIQQEMGNEGLYALHHSRVYGLCMSRLRNPEDAEDATQETFSRAMGAGENVSEGWLITVARNVCTDHLRRRSRTLSLVSARDDEYQPAQAGPDVEVVGQAAVRHLLSQLTGAERNVVAATVLDDRSHADAARTLGIASGTSRVLLSRAARKMRTYLSDHPEMLGAQLAFPAVRVLRRLRELAALALDDAVGRTAAVGVPSMMAAIAAMAPAAVPGTLAAAPLTGGAVVASQAASTIARVSEVPAVPAQPESATGAATASPQAPPDEASGLAPQATAAAPSAPSSNLVSVPTPVSVTASSIASLPSPANPHLSLTVRATIGVSRSCPSPNASPGPLTGGTRMRFRAPQRLLSGTPPRHAGPAGLKGPRPAECWPDGASSPSLLGDLAR